MAGIGTAARNWEEEQKQQQGIGTAAYHEPQQGIGTPASNQGNNQGISTPAYNEPQQGIGEAASKASGAQTTQPIKTLEGVSDATRNKLNSLQTGYQPGAAAQNVQQQLQQLQANKPAGYTSQYAGQLQGILAEIQGQKPFQYSFSGDALFNSLKDVWQEQAKQASMNAQAQAAGLTGGYGNSAAQLAGSQAYQHNIQGLYDKGLDTAKFAYDVYQGEQADRYNRLNALMNLDEQAYGRNRDEMADYKDERDYLTNRADTLDEREYSRWMNDMDYAMKLAQIENADYRNEQERQEAIRQFQLQYDADQAKFNWQKDVDQRDYDRNVLESDRNYALNQQQLQEQIRQFEASLDWEKMSAQQKQAAQLALQILASGKMPTEDMLEAAGVSAEDANLLMARPTGSGSGNGGNIYYVDASGNYYTLSNGKYSQVDADKVPRNAKVDTSRAGDIMIQNTGTAIGNTVNTIKQQVQNPVNNIMKLLGL